jgi:DnaK suppressor protein
MSPGAGWLSCSMPTHLTPAQLQELRSELERELARLRVSTVPADASSQPMTDAGDDPIADVDAMANQQLAKELHSHEQALAVNIEDALQRMDDGSYGTCASCGAAIPFGRLLVMPEARTCVSCEGA